ncbi:MAG: choice-of-anchor I family protein [Chitinophagaceae bacterium]|nr:choice-of-anchor I family protein [Chitinophagaceae bacterium]
MKRKLLMPLAVMALLASCTPGDLPHPANEDAASFEEISSIQVGGEGAAEISAFDPVTKKLFVVTNNGTTRIDVIDLSNPANPQIIGNIDITPFGGGVNSVAVSNGRLAAAVEGFAKTDNGKVVVFKTNDYSVVKQIVVGALPDMVTFTHDGKYILTANEGEPNSDYSIDPVGTVSIIAVNQGYSVKTIDFSSFAGQAAALKAKGLRVYGPNASFAQDMEPEYITVSQDGNTAWVTLQENNAIAKINIPARKVTHIFPLGFKSYNIAGNEVDPSDRDGGYTPASWNVKGMYEPDAIAVLEQFGTPYLFTANEGDAREYDNFVELKRVKDLTLDPTAFPDATIRQDAKLGRLNVTTTLGDTDGDGDFDELYSLGSRSFTVWNGNTGSRIFDSGNDLDEQCIAISKYDDGRSDDKSVEPEGITLGPVGNKVIAFVGMERADVVSLYDVTNPRAPRFIKSLVTGDAPEGLLLIPAQKSPTGKSLLVVTSEGDGFVKVYSTL